MRVIRGNHVIHECATQEDAEILINASEAFSMEHFPGVFSTSAGEKMVYLNSHEWLDNLIENRKKYKNI